MDTIGSKKQKISNVSDLIESFKMISDPTIPKIEDEDDDAFLLGVPPHLPNIGLMQTQIELPSSQESKENLPDFTKESMISEGPEELSESATRLKPVRIPDKMYFRMGDVSGLTQIKPYVIRFWETEFKIISPEKSATGQRVYTRLDVENILLIKHLLYSEKLSIELAKRKITKLKKEGRLKAYKIKNIFGGEKKISMDQSLKEALDIVNEMQNLLRSPLKDFFKY